MDKELTCEEIEAIPPNVMEWSSIRVDYIPDASESKSPVNNDTPVSVDYDEPIIEDSSLEDVDLSDKEIKKKDISYLLPVAVAESVTAGALSNTLCSEPGSSKFFLGGITAYNMETQKNILHVDAYYAEKNNFANPYTTFTMAKNVTDIFKSRIGISTTGYSLPTYREAAPGKCEINVRIPYAYICIYDALMDTHKIYKVTNDNYNNNDNRKVQRAQMQAKVALYCKKLFDKYCQSVS